jgi:hypothetical protein
MVWSADDEVQASSGGNAAIDPQLSTEQLETLRNLGIDVDNVSLSSIPAEALDTLTSPEVHGAVTEALNPQERKLVLQDPNAISAIANAAAAIEGASSLEELEKINVGGGPQVAAVVNNLKLSRQSELEAQQAIGSVFGFGKGLHDKEISPHMALSGILLAPSLAEYANENAQAPNFTQASMFGGIPTPAPQSAIQMQLMRDVQAARNADAIGLG